MLVTTVFIDACKNCNYEVAEKIYKLENIPDDIVHRAFVSSCARGNLKMAIWLDSLSYDTNSYYDLALSLSTENTHHAVSKWLRSAMSNYR